MVHNKTKQESYKAVFHGSERQKEMLLAGSRINVLKHKHVEDVSPQENATVSSKQNKVVRTTIKALKEDGFTKLFGVEDGTIVEPNSQHKFSPKGFKVHKTFRFYEPSHAGEESIVMAIEHKELPQWKGLLVMTNGPSTSVDEKHILQEIFQ